ncbi:MAG TPA: hypothetical protein VGN18_04975 [Jatrophihabitans sp.]|jgi:hypothetical protein|uniref:hypothetical protein n=1 Tax=Jatrophihabitans sp. TaxID=1932789 RepID=UPI002DFB46E6|nr:hypothetical protein [Jatrophihabitans sp.]
MKRSRILLAAGTTAILLSATAANPAEAAPITPSASGYASAASTGTATLGATLALSGSLGSLLDGLIGPIVSSTLNPLVSAISGTVNTAVASTFGAASPYNAATGSGTTQVTTAPAAFPNDTLPSPCTAGGSQPCMSGANIALSAPPLATAQVGTINGYAEQVASTADATSPIFGRAGVANTNVSLLSGVPTLIPGLPSVTNPLVNVNAVAAKSNCPNDGATGASKPKTAPSVGIEGTGMSLLGGLITFDVVGTQIANLKVNGTAYGTVLNLPTLTISGITVSQYGRAVLVSIPLTLNQVMAALGITGTLASSLTSYATGSTVALNLVVGPNSTLTNRTASAWGLGIGADLSGALTFNLQNLVTATVTVPSGLTGANYGNVLDLRLAYTACQSGVVLPAVVPIVPVALV